MCPMLYEVISLVLWTSGAIVGSPLSRTPITRYLTLFLLWLNIMVLPTVAVVPIHVRNTMISSFLFLQGASFVPFLQAKHTRPIPTAGKFILWIAVLTLVVLTASTWNSL